ncbi:MAG TPA: hypothetical protein VFZ22_06530 [Pyrinomonadaceae bacterium]|nr:hypothetical protein [Pyrinomonadaceae bacterium]
MSEKDQTTPIGPNNPETEASLDEKMPSSGRRQFMTGVASAIGAGVVLNAAASNAAAAPSAPAVQGQIISFKLSKADLASIGEVVTRLQVTSSGVDPTQPGAFTIRNHSFNPDQPGAFTIRNHNFNAASPGAYTIRNYQFSAV